MKGNNYMYIQLSASMRNDLIEFQQHNIKPHFLKVVDELSNSSRLYTKSSLDFLNKFVHDVNNALSLNLKPIKDLTQIHPAHDLPYFTGRIIKNGHTLAEFTIISADKSGDTFLSQQFGSTLQNHLKKDHNWMFNHSSYDFFYQTYDLTQNKYASSIQIALRCVKTMGFKIIDMIPNYHVAKPYKNPKELLSQYQKNRALKNKNELRVINTNQGKPCLVADITTKNQQSPNIYQFLLYLVTIKVLENETNLVFNIKSVDDNGNITKINPQKNNTLRILDGLYNHNGSDNNSVHSLSLFGNQAQIHNHNIIHNINNTDSNDNSAKSAVFQYSKYGYGLNLLIYGAPGTGKSYYASHYGKKYFTKTENVTFSPGFRYEDLVIKINPSVKNGHAFYNYQIGALTKQLIRAYNHPEHQYLLILNEFNRAKPSVVLKGFSQLIERDQNGISIDADVGDSNLAQYLDRHVKGKTDFLQNGIRLPSNLSVIATMNYNGFGAFQLSNAMLRRWLQKYMPIQFDNTTVTKDYKISGFNTTWQHLDHIINCLISEYHLGVNGNSLLGQYWITKKDISSRSNVASKLIHYLWTITNGRHQVFFDPKYHTFNDVYNKFVNSKQPLNIFNMHFIKLLRSDAQ